MIIKLESLYPIFRDGNFQKIFGNHHHLEDVESSSTASGITPRPIPIFKKTESTMVFQYPAASSTSSACALQTANLEGDTGNFTCLTRRQGATLTWRLYVQHGRFGTRSRNVVNGGDRGSPCKRPLFKKRFY